MTYQIKKCLCTPHVGAFETAVFFFFSKLSKGVRENFYSTFPHTKKYEITLHNKRNDLLSVCCTR